MQFHFTENSISKFTGISVIYLGFTTKTEKKLLYEPTDPDFLKIQSKIFHVQINFQTFQEHFFYISKYCNRPIFTYVDDF